MFTGIIKGIGRVESRDDTAGADPSFTFALEQTELGTLALGASIAVNGVCLTVTGYDDEAFTADVSRATLDVTTLGRLRPGDRVNLEPSLRLGDPLDGHWVTGHVDGVGHVTAIGADGGSTTLEIELPRELERFVARKGSIAVDGVSLTVNSLADASFRVNIIPHTRQVTIIGRYDVGTAVNIEVDIVARYLERLTHHDR
jgi:riboflavin synthase